MHSRSATKHSKSIAETIAIHSKSLLSPSVIPAFPLLSCPTFLIGNPVSLLCHAGCRPRATRSFCFGKRTQNHWRPGVALRVPAPRSRWCGLRNSLRFLRLRSQETYAQGERIIPPPFVLSPSTALRTGVAERSRRTLRVPAPAGAKTWRHTMPRLHMQRQRQNKDAGFPIKNVGNDRKKCRG